MTPSQPPGALLLDFDGVLAHYSRPARLAQLAAHAGCSSTDVHQALFVSGLETAYDAGQIGTADYLGRLGQAIGRPIDEDTWIAARIAACRPFARTVETAAHLARKMPVAILTNNGPLITRAIEQLLPALAPALKGRIFCSAQFGGRKPQREIFQRALEALDAAPQQTLFIDDLFVNVQGARTAGLHAETARDERSFKRVMTRYKLAD
ncbi:MAG TPA: HAD family phosphatase [Stenotrophomonas sp.]|nr:HAD family phosphatase [Stenotrophomonas sp.]